jgi:DNA-binding NarL/FixJ family response regulator
MPDRIKVLLVEDDMDFVYLIKKMLDNENDMELCNYAENKYAGLELAKVINPDIVLMDLNLTKSNLDGIDGARLIRLATRAKVLLLTSFENPEIIIDSSKKAFASGYIFKSQCQALPDTIRRTSNGHTPEELYIKELILSDLSPAERSIFNKILGQDINLQSSNKTISNQKTTIYKKLGVKNSIELVHLFR